MSMPEDHWTSEQADEWTIHDLLAAVLAILSYALTLVGIAGALLLRTWGFVALAAGIASVVLMYLVIDPKLRAMSKAFAQRQDEFLKHVDRTTRWEQ
jgi:small-conductance mechanosensitive channel